MARIAKTTTHFVLISAVDSRGCVRQGEPREYAVEERQGQVRRTIGRVYGGGGGKWMGLPVAGTAWTLWHDTRAEALDALRRRESCVEEQEKRWRALDAA
jgi:hypothetical protein